jgi:hypothetical protein
MNEEKKVCECGCGQVVNPGCRYIFGHQNRSQDDRRRISAKLKGKKKLKREPDQKVEKPEEPGISAQETTGNASNVGSAEQQQ